MTRIRHLCLLVVALLIATSVPALAGISANLELDAFLTGYFKEYVGNYPETATALGDLSNFGLEAQNGRWDDRSDKSRLSQLASDKRRLQYLRGLSSADIPQELAVSVEAIKWYLDDQVRREPFLYHAYVLDPGFGIQTYVPSFLTGTHPIVSLADAEDYVKRLQGVGVLFDQVIQASEARAKAGLIPPRYIVETVGEQCQSFVSAPVESCVLYESFVSRLDGISGMTPAQQERLVAQARKAVEKVAYPAYRRLARHCERLAPRASIKAGVWELPNGDAYYRYILRSRTSTDMTPQEIHQLGLSEVKRITGEIRQCLAELGIGPQVAFPVALRQATDGLLYDREEIFALYQDSLTDMEPVLPKLFGVLPKAKVSLEAVPKIRQMSSPSYYEPSSLDGSRPGVFYANLAQPTERHHMRPLLFHEAIPGHHLQLSIQQEEPSIPMIQKVLYFDGFVEGWALYAERLAGEHGFYPDAAFRAAYLQSELFRAARLVIDTGLHYKRWSRDQAIQYMADVTGQPRTAEIDRYIVVPGQACAYKAGELKLIQLRERARIELGARFDLREFHDVVLRHGSLPLEVLEQEVTRYIQSKKA